jgi:hypothetical protein
LEKVPVGRFSSCSGSEDVGFLVMDDEADERERSEAFFCIEMTCMEGEEVEGIDICVDPWFPWVEDSFCCAILCWWSWNKVW